MLNKLFIKINQEFAFSDFMMRGKKSTSIFFPGCSFMKFGSDMIYKTLNTLKKYDNNVEVCSLCCGRPSEVLDKKYQNKYENKLINYIKNNNINKIYLACPNCFDKLNFIKNKYKLNIDILLIYTILNEQLKTINNFKFHTIDDAVVIHDPCSIKNENVVHKSVRDILKCAGQKYIEADKNCAETICCGNKNMLHIINKKASKKITNVCLKNLLCKSDVILSYCNGCLYTFSNFNIKTIHLIEIIFGKIKNQNYLNRIKFVKGLDKC